MGVLTALRARPLPYILQGFFWGAAVPIFINDNLCELTFITGSSMSPTLSPLYHTTGSCDTVLWRKHNPYANIRRGDVVQYMNPYKPDARAVKRVIGLEGDTVILDRRRRPGVGRDGREGREVLGWDAWGGRVVVPPGHVWVEGDNVGKSRDSNDYGPVSKSLIEGRAVTVVTFGGGRFWTKPWEGYKTKTRVIQGGGRVEDWTLGLPVGLEEVGAGPRWPT